ncbi:MAG: hypothetical protein JWR20_1988, partial [Marmoricola sp.]|nr:hypothetical protein [Marmoricola sp.]
MTAMSPVSLDLSRDVVALTEA